mgnify:CR=1 FL=1
MSRRSRRTAKNASASQLVKERKRPQSEWKEFNEKELQMLIPALSEQRILPKNLNAALKNFCDGDFQVNEDMVSGTPAKYVIARTTAAFLFPLITNKRTVQTRVNNLLLDRQVSRSTDEETAALEEAIDLMKSDPEGIFNLMSGIFENGAPADPVEGVLRKDGFVDVCEGNRRTTCLYVLHGKVPEHILVELYKKKQLERIKEMQAEWMRRSISVKIYLDLSIEQWNSKLQRRHSAHSTLSWSAFTRSQAMFSQLCNLLEADDDPVDLKFTSIADLGALRAIVSNKENIPYLKKIATECGCATKYTSCRSRIMAFGMYLLGVNLYGDYRMGGKFDTYAKFYATSLKALVDGRRLSVKIDGVITPTTYTNKNIEKDFLKWIATRRITDTIQVAVLGDILGNDRGRAIFMEEGIVAAQVYMEKLSNRPERLIDAAQTAIFQVDKGSLTDKDENDLGRLRQKIDELLRQGPKPKAKPPGRNKPKK